MSEVHYEKRKEWLTKLILEMAKFDERVRISLRKFTDEEFLFCYEIYTNSMWTFFYGSTQNDIIIYIRNCNKNLVRCSLTHCLFPFL